MSVADALMLMLVFGDFVLSLIALIISIMVMISAINDNTKSPKTSISINASATDN